jgi:nucleoside-diphosphate-sugar epimerase
MAQVRFSILGANGFVGQRVISHLRESGHEVLGYGREEPLPSDNMGHVIYCIGLTADFRSRPVETIEAHAALGAQLLYKCRFDSWLYLSSTRVYGGTASKEIVSEQDSISVYPSSDTTYDLSKLLGEAVCLGHGMPTVRVARLSNVYGPDQNSPTFLNSVIGELRDNEAVTIREAPDSSKDYISIDDVAHLLARIAVSGKERLYNVASGVPVAHQQIAQRLTELTGKPVKFLTGASTRTFPRISIARIQSEFSFAPQSLLRDLPKLL